MAIQTSLNSIDGQGMQCGIGNGVNAQVKIIRMNAMNREPKLKQERVCVYVCACAKGKKTNDGEYQYFRDIFPRRWRVLRTVQRHQPSNDKQHTGLKPLKRRPKLSTPILVVTVVVQGNTRKGAKQVPARCGLQAIRRTWYLQSGMGCVLLLFEMERRRLLHSAKVDRVHSV